MEALHGAEIAHHCWRLCICACMHACKRWLLRAHMALPGHRSGCSTEISAHLVQFTPAGAGFDVLGHEQLVLPRRLELAGRGGLLRVAPRAGGRISPEVSLLTKMLA